MVRDVPIVESIKYWYSMGVNDPDLPDAHRYAVNPRKLNKKLAGSEIKNIISNLLN